MQPRTLTTMRVLVVGFGATGKSVARFLGRHDIAYEVADECDHDTAVAITEEYGCKAHTEFSSGLFAQFDVLVLSPGIPRSTPSVLDALNAGVDVIGDIELFAGVVDMPVIAVTGSNGKSTVVSWITHALKTAGINAVACGNIGLPALESLQEAADVYVLELSSYQLESTRSLKPLSAAMTTSNTMHRLSGVCMRYPNIAFTTKMTCEPGRMTAKRHHALCIASRLTIENLRKRVGTELCGKTIFIWQMIIIQC